MGAVPAALVSPSQTRLQSIEKLRSILLMLQSTRSYILCSSFAAARLTVSNSWGCPDRRASQLSLGAASADELRIWQVKSS